MSGARPSESIQRECPHTASASLCEPTNAARCPSRISLAPKLQAKDGRQQQPDETAERETQMPARGTRHRPPRNRHSQTPQAPKMRRNRNAPHKRVRAGRQATHQIGGARPRQRPGWGTEQTVRTGAQSRGRQCTKEPQQPDHTRQRRHHLTQGNPRRRRGRTAAPFEQTRDASPRRWWRPQGRDEKAIGPQGGGQGQHQRIPADGSHTRPEQPRRNQTRNVRASRVRAPGMGRVT